MALAMAVMSVFGIFWQMLAIVLMKLIFVARKALLAFLMSSFNFYFFVQFDSPFIWLQICGEYGVCVLVFTMLGRECLLFPFFCWRGRRGLGRRVGRRVGWLGARILGGCVPARFSV